MSTNPVSSHPEAVNASTAGAETSIGSSWQRLLLPNTVKERGLS